MEGKSLVIRRMHRNEMSTIINWSTNEGWNPGDNDAECFYLADSEGFLIGLINDEPVATISVVKYGSSFGFLGFYIVKPKYRGKGYGIQIWNAGMEYLKGRNIGLDGVIDQQENYRKSGFRFAYNNIRFEGTGGSDFPTDPGIIQLSSLPNNIIESYDRDFFPEKRSKFVRCWVNQQNHHALGIVKNRKLVGYGVIRKCNSGYKIGPLFADNPQLADTLFQALISRLRSTEKVYLDIPEVNKSAIDLVRKYNMKEVFETARMYTKETPKIKMNGVFGVTSFELG